jgi:hypothetical protein
VSAELEALTSPEILTQMKHRLSIRKGSAPEQHVRHVSKRKATVNLETCTPFVDLERMNTTR